MSTKEDREGDHLGSYLASVLHLTKDEVLEFDDLCQSIATAGNKWDTAEERCELIGLGTTEREAAEAEAESANARYVAAVDTWKTWCSTHRGFERPILWTTDRRFYITQKRALVRRAKTLGSETPTR